MKIKQELLCKHRHTIKTHPSCFQGGKLIDDAQWWKKIKTGYLDIEASNLKANFGHMISWSIKDLKTGKVYYDSITSADILSGKFDKRIVKSLLSAIKEFDCLVTYYGTGFDIPFIRTRAFSHGFDFPNFGLIKHIDLYYTVKSKLCLTRKSLEVACELFGIEGKTRLDPAIWIMATIGNAKAVKEVLNHNIADVDILQQLHSKLETQSKFTKKSL